MAFQTWDKAVLIPTEQLVFTDWNCNEMSHQQLAELQADIEGNGEIKFDEPIHVVPIAGQTNKYLVIGGEHRTKVMISLNQDQVPCVIRHDLADKSRQELMLWSVRRNNLRGRVNADKYAALESELVNDYQMSEEAARQTMLIGDGLARELELQLKKEKPSKEADDSTFDDYEVDNSVSEQNEEARQRAELLNALKIVEQDVLLDSADTVPFGYLFFVQGKEGQTHLVVDESEELHSLVGKMVYECKEDLTRVDSFLTSAIENELKRSGD